MLDLKKERIQKIFNDFNSDLIVQTINSFGSGLYNEVYLVTCDYSDLFKTNQFVLRIAPPVTTPQLFYEKYMMRSEPDIHKSVLQNTKLPVPRIYYFDFSGNFLNRDFLIMEYLPGVSGSFRQFQLGEYVAQLHRIKGDQFGYSARDLKIFGTWKECFLYYVNLIFNDCLKVKAITKDEHQWFLGVYDKFSWSIRECAPSLLHLDLWNANILSQDDEITGILDFDRGLFGDPELEFAVLDTYGYSSPAFFHGYAQERTFDTNAQIRQKLYIVYELIKYAFIRLARGGAYLVSRNHVIECQSVLKSLNY